jgi:hypothetical protein
MTIKKQTKRGRQADHLKLTGYWRERMRQAITKKRPASGWPKPTKKKVKG